MQLRHLAALGGVLLAGACSSFSAATTASTDPASDGGSSDALAPVADAASPAVDGAACPGGAQAIYVFGGSVMVNGQKDHLSASVWRAPLHCDGTLGAWAVAAPLPRKVDSPNVGILSGKLVFLNGDNDDGSSAPLATTVWIYDREADGGLTSPAARETTITARWRAAAAQTDGALYVLGGEDINGAALEAVERLELVDGKPVVSSLTHLRQRELRFGAAALAGGIIVLGANENPAYAPLTNADVGDWTDIGPDVTRKEQDPAVAVANGVAYFIGGTTTAAKVSIARLENGVPSFLDGVAIDPPMSGVAAVSANGRVYFIGGSLGTGVKSAVPNESGFVDLRDEPSMTDALENHAAIAF